MSWDEPEYVEVGSVVEKTNGLQAYQQDKAAIDMQISTAKQYPRSWANVTNNCIQLIAMDKEFAKKCTYALSKGGSPIAGPSVYLARLIAQQMGNLRIDSRVVSFDDTHVTCEALAFDMEKNYAFRSQTKKSIVGKNGKYSEDLQSITANAAAAIATRNVIFNVVPQQVTNKLYKECLNKVLGDVSTEAKLVAKRTTIVNALKEAYAEKKLTEEEIAKAAGKESILHLKETELAILLGFETAIQDGEQTFEWVFRNQGKSSKPIVVTPKDESEERLIGLMEKCKNRKELEKLQEHVKTEKQRNKYDEMYKSLK